MPRNLIRSSGSFGWLGISVGAAGEGLLAYPAQDRAGVDGALMGSDPADRIVLAGQRPAVLGAPLRGVLTTLLVAEFVTLGRDRVRDPVVVP
jgi:hypothetical protein